MKYKRVIFVSMDNTCLGPAAESIFNRIAGEREIEAISRGMVVLFPEPMNAKMVSIMREHGFGLQKELSEPLTEEDITEDTLLLAMWSFWFGRCFQRQKCINFAILSARKAMWKFHWAEVLRIMRCVMNILTC